ncbi:MULTISPECIES: hypothetical protein [Cupriavidus]|uniref:hypothetical protein n=1 Tax=Cupriavidus TaxID=106589 RepID=UPI000377CFC2|nr:MULTISPECIES: hypothetical protein [Cupriavidus]
MAQPSRSAAVEAELSYRGPLLGLSDMWAQAAEKIGALNAQTAAALFAEGAEYAAETAARPFSFGMFRPEMTDVIGQRIAAYVTSLNEILHAAHQQWAQGVQQQFAFMTGGDPFQFCVMGRDFLPEGTSLPAVGEAMTQWVTACLPGAAPLLPAPAGDGAAPA